MWTKIIVATVLSFCLCATQDALAACAPEHCGIVKPPFNVLLGNGPPQTFPLVCRGGDSTDGVNFRFTAVTKTLWITFQAGTQPAEQGLMPGQCSWRDRGFRPGEIPLICHRDFNLQFDGKISQVGQLLSSSLILNVTVNDALALLYVSDMRKPDCFVFFDVFNEGQCMHVVNARRASESCQ